MKLKTITQKRQFQFGDCISESQKVYNYFKNKRYNPKMIEGWVEVNDGYDLEPDMEFLEIFDEEIYFALQKRRYWGNYKKVLKHTWVEVNGHIIDITKNQFDKYDGILKYFELERYKLCKV